MELLQEIGEYWNRRAPSYSAEVNRERRQGNEKAWLAVMQENLPQGQNLQILDVGTGPGFFAVMLAGQGHRVTAVDYSRSMLEEARRNAGRLCQTITFLRMDAQCLSLPDQSYDAVVSRDLTWNLERPQQAYQEWYRVLKPGGTLLNFDAGWYEYLFNQDKQEAFQQDRLTVARQKIEDLNAYEEAAHMEEISRQLVMSRCQRPDADIVMLRKAGFREVTVNREIWRRVWDAVQKTNNASTPCFLVKAVK